VRRVLAVVVIGVLMTLSLGVDQVSWAAQDTGGKDREAQRAQVVRRLAGLRPGAMVEIERTDRTKVKAVIEDIGPDSIRALVEESHRGGTAGRGVVTQTIPIDDIRNIREVRPGRSNRALIAAAVVAGLVVLVGVCAASISA
jgi:hypothetical protein